MYPKEELEQFIYANKNNNTEMHFTFLNKNFSRFNTFSSLVHFITTMIGTGIGFAFVFFTLSFQVDAVRFGISLALSAILACISAWGSYWALHKYGLSILKKIPFLHKNALAAIEGKRRWFNFVNDSSRHNAVLYLMEKTFALANSTGKVDKNVIASRNLAFIGFKEQLEHQSYYGSLYEFNKFLSEYQKIIKQLKLEDNKSNSYEEYKKQLDSLFIASQQEKPMKELEMSVNGENVPTARNIL